MKGSGLGFRVEGFYPKPWKPIETPTKGGRPFGGKLRQGPNSMPRLGMNSAWPSGLRVRGLGFRAEGFWVLVHGFGGLVGLGVCWVDPQTL